jgi:hypothetical protein
VETDFYAITEIAKMRNEIIVGYKKITTDGMLMKTNPKKSERISFSADDYLIVIAAESN